MADYEEELELLKVKKDEAVKGADYEAAAALRDESEKLRKKKDDIQKEWR